MLQHPTSRSLASLATLAALASCAGTHSALQYRDRVFQVESRRDAEYIAGELVRRGTAFLISDDGRVLTCAHNLLGGVGSQVMLRSRGENLTARVLAVDPEADLALLQTADLPRARALRFGVHGIRRAEALWIVGYRKIENAERDAIVSHGSAGELVHYRELLATEVKIVEGFSGGPVLNADGAVVGLALLADGAVGTFGGAYILPLDALRAGYQELLRRTADP